MAATFWISKFRNAARKFSRFLRMVIQAKPQLEAFEAELFEQTGVVGDWPAPFAIVIVPVEGVDPAQRSRIGSVGVDMKSSRSILAV